jgi:hypothetical protein
VCGLNAIVLFQRQRDLPMPTLTPERSFSHWNINVHVLHTSNIALTPCRVPGWFPAFLAQGVVRVPMDLMLLQSAACLPWNLEMKDPCASDALVWMYLRKPSPVRIRLHRSSVVYLSFSNVRAHTLEPISNLLLPRVKTLTQVE